MGLSGEEVNHQGHKRDDEEREWGYHGDLWNYPIVEFRRPSHGFGFGDAMFAFAFR